MHSPIASHCRQVSNSHYCCTTNYVFARNYMSRIFHSTFAFENILHLSHIFCAQIFLLVYTIMIITQAVYYINWLGDAVPKKHAQKGINLSSIIWRNYVSDDKMRNAIGVTNSELNSRITSAWDAGKNNRTHLLFHIFLIRVFRIFTTSTLDEFLVILFPFRLSWWTFLKWHSAVIPSFRYQNT